MLDKIFSFFSKTTNTENKDENQSLLSAFDTTIDMNELEQNNNNTIVNPNEDQQENNSTSVRKPTPRTQKLLNEKQTIEDAIKKSEEEILDIQGKIEKDKTEESLLDECIQYIDKKRRGFVAQHPWLVGGTILALAGTGLAAHYSIKAYNWRFDLAMDKELDKYSLNDFSQYPPEYFPDYTCATIIPTWYYCRPVESLPEYDPAGYYCENIALNLCKTLYQQHYTNLGISGASFTLGVIANLIGFYKIMSQIDSRNDSTLKSLLAKVNIDHTYLTLNDLANNVAWQKTRTENSIAAHSVNIKDIKNEIATLTVQSQNIDTKINAINMYETNCVLFQSGNRKAVNSESPVYTLPREIAQEILSYVNPKDFLPAKPKI